MSVLIALKDKKRVIVGVDTRMSASDTFHDSYTSRPKAFHIDNELTAIVGGVGNVGLVDLFSDVMTKHKDKWNVINRKYISMYIIPEIVGITFNLHYDMHNKMDGELFFAYKDKAFFISGNFSVNELIDFEARGSGGAMAEASLYTSRDFSLTPEERVARAIEATGYTINTVSQLGYIGDTKGKLFTPINIKK